MDSALITLVSVSISVSIGLILPVMLYLDRQRRQQIKEVEERLEKTSKERHDQVMRRFDEWPVREFENRITVVEQASGQPPEQAWGRAQAQARASRQAAE